MKIAIINNLYEPFARGGAEAIAKLQFEGLSRKGHDVIVISLKSRGVFVEKSDKYYYLNSIFPNLNKVPKIIRLFWHFLDVFSILNYFRVKKILKINKIDTVITHNMTGFGKLLYLHISKNYQHLHILHDIAFLHPSGLMFYQEEGIMNSATARLFQKVTRYFTARSSFIISPSAWLLDLYLQNNFFPKAKTKVLANPINKNNFSEKIDVEDEDDDFIFLYVGIISRAKGVDVLLNAFLNFQKKYKKAKLVLIGSEIKGDLFVGVKNNSSIKYLGKLQNDLILKNMQMANCLVMPSVCYENSPTVIYEAMSTGLPVISSRIGGATELIEKFGGLLFEPSNSLDLQNSMKQMLTGSSEIKKTSLLLKRDVLEACNLEIYINKIEKFINC